MPDDSVTRLDELSAEYSERFARLEAKWVDRHREAQGMIDALGIAPVVPLDGLYSFLTRGLDESFERATNELYEEFDREAQALNAE